MAEIFYDADADLALIQSRKVAVLGYGSQGRAHALNLRDSGLDVVVGLRPDGATRAKALADGFAVVTPEEAVKGADLVAVAVERGHDLGHELARRFEHLLHQVGVGFGVRGQGLQLLRSLQHLLQDEGHVGGDGLEMVHGSGRRGVSCTGP